MNGEGEKGMTRDEIKALVWATSALNEAQTVVKPGVHGGKIRRDYSAQVNLLIGVIIREMRKTQERPELLEEGE